MDSFEFELRRRFQDAWEAVSIARPRVTKFPRLPGIAQPMDAFTEFFGIVEEAWSFGWGDRRRMVAYAEYPEQSSGCRIPKIFEQDGSPPALMHRLGEKMRDT